MRWSLIWLIAGAGTRAVGQTPAPDSGLALTPELAISLRAPSDLQFSPDGSRLAFVLAEPPRGDERARHVWLLDVGSRTVRQFTNSQKSETAPRWAPAGRWLAFLSDRDEFTQIYLMRPDGGEARPLTSGKRAIGAYEWSPDGRRIAFLAPDPRTEAEERREKDKDDARVVDRDDKHTRLWVVEVPSGDVRAMTPPEWQVSELQWTRAGDQLIVSATDRPASDRETHRILAVNLSDGAMRQIAAPRGSFGGLRVSPDGKTLYYIGCRVDGPIPHDLIAVPLPGGAPANLTAASVDRPIQQFDWQPDGSLLALVASGFRTALVGLSAAGERRALPSLATNPGPFAIARGGLVAFVGQSATEPPEIFLWDRKASPVRVSQFNEPWRRVVLGRPEYVRYRSFDGLEIEAAVLVPAGYDRRSRLPLVALIHGGPTGRWSEAIEPWGQLLAAHGYAVLYPNVRGSTGYGQPFMERNRGDWGGGDFRDVMVGIDTVIARGVGDSARLGIGGWSYGGYMAEWAITQTDRFKAAVAGAGLANLVSEFGTEVSSAYDEWFYGLPYEQPEGFWRSSPVLFLRRVHTPTLILQGEADRVDPLGQSQELYRGLKRYGVETEFVVYPREPHGLREEHHLVDRLRRVLAWYEGHLKQPR